MKYIWRKHEEQVFHWYIVWMDVLSTFLTWINMFMHYKRIEKPQWAKRLCIKTPKIAPCTWGSRTHPSVAQLWQLDRFMFSYNNATNSPLVTMGHPISTPKIAHSYGWLAPPLTLHIFEPTWTPNRIQICSAIFLHFTKQTDTKSAEKTYTNRPLMLQSRTA